MREPSRDNRSWSSALVLVALAIVPYAGTWAYGFVDYDDDSTIVGLPLIRNLSWRALPEFFRPDIHPGLPEYMPLKNLSYALDYAAFGLWPPGFRLQQQFFYVASVLLLWLWLRAVLTRVAREGRLGMPAHFADRLALLTAALFALHPCHVESVTWLSGRKDVLSGAFMLATLYCAWNWQSQGRGQRGWLLAALCCCGLSLLSKPMAVMLPPLLVLQDFACGPRRSLSALLRERWVLYLGTTLMAAGFAVLYFTLVHAYTAASSGLQARLYLGPSYLRWGQQLAAFAGLAYAPTKLAPLYPPSLLDPDLLSVRALIGLALLLFVGASAAHALMRRQPWSLALGLFLLPLTPVLVAPAWGQYFAARYLYHAVAGALLSLLWVIGLLLARRPHLRKVAPYAAFLLAAFFTLTTLDYNRKWQNGLALWLGALEVYPAFTEFHDLAARAALRAHKPQLAIKVLSACLEREPGEPQCNAVLGGLLLQSQPLLGERLLRRALAQDRSGTAHLRLAQHLASQGRAREGMALYARWLSGRAVEVAQIEALARLALVAGKYDQALDAARQAVRAGSVNHPASAPPAELLSQVAHARGDPVLSAAVQAALRRCSRVDCLKRTLGW